MLTTDICGNGMDIILESCGERISQDHLGRKIAIHALWAII